MVRVIKHWPRDIHRTVLTLRPREMKFKIREIRVGFEERTGGEISTSTASTRNSKSNFSDVVFEGKEPL